VDYTSGWSHEVMAEHEDGTFRPVIGGNTGASWTRTAQRAERLNSNRPEGETPFVVVSRMEDE
jgi:hypothetical protein